VNLSSTKITICEVLRRINDRNQGNSGKEVEIRKLIFQAVEMAKRMQYKLLEYKKDYDKDWWKKNPDYEKDLKRRSENGYKWGK